MLISLLRFPGNGQRDVTLPEGATVADLVAAESLAGRNIMVDGAAVDRSAFASTVLTSGCEVAAIAVSKGN